MFVIKEVIVKACLVINIRTRLPQAKIDDCITKNCFEPKLKSDIPFERIFRALDNIMLKNKNIRVILFLHGLFSPILCLKFCDCRHQQD